MDLQYLGPLLYEIIVFISATFVLLKLVRRYMERRNPVIKYMLIFTSGMAVAIFVAAISRVLRLTEVWEIEPDVFIELLAVSVALIGIGDIGLLAFTLEIFYGGMSHGKNKLYVMLYLVVIILNAIYAISTGIFDVDLNNNIWLLVILISVFIYIILIRAALKLAGKLDTPVEKKCTILIAYAGVSIMAVFVLFMLDSALGGNFTVFYYSAWIFVVISVMLLYLSVIQPPKFKAWLGKRK